MRAALAAAILGFVPGLLDVFASPKAIALRVLGLPLLVLAAARGTNALRRGGPAAWRPRTPVEWADLAAVAWMLVSIASALAGLSPRTSLLGEIGQREGVLTTLALGGLWFGARASQRDATDARRTAALVRNPGAAPPPPPLDPARRRHAAARSAREGGRDSRTEGSLGMSHLLAAEAGEHSPAGRAGSRSGGFQPRTNASSRSRHGPCAFRRPRFPK